MVRHPAEPEPPVELSQYEIALWHTVAINQSLDYGLRDHVEPTPVAFRTQFARDERVVGGGPFVLLDYSATGDGTYLRDGGFFFATGAAGLAITGLLAAGRAMGNARRRDAAAAAAVPRWRQIEQGVLYVSTAGFYLQTARALLPWSYAAVDAMWLVGPGALNFQGNSDAGRISWVLASDWAELTFTLWARLMHPQHPQFTGRSWLPAGWIERARASRFGLPYR